MENSDEINTENVTLNQIPNPTQSHIALLAAKMNNNYYAILDSGTTDTYLTEEALTIHKTAYHEKIKVTVPNGSQLISSQKRAL